MSWTVKLRRGEGPVAGRLKRAARAALTFHLPVNRLTRPVFDLLYRANVAGREGLQWAGRFFWNEPLFRSRCEAVGPGLWMEALPYITGDGRIVLGAGVRLSGKSSIGFGRTAPDPPELVIGDGTFVGHGCRFTVGRSVRVGRHCLLAAGVQVFDMDGHPLDAESRRAGHPTPPDQIAPVAIGDDAWVGAGAVILKGVTVGDRAVVAARAVVTRDVPTDAVVAGNPAKVVRMLPPPAGPG
jgi:carbonic anhydrase/acetyltransferase-like protein (isoleucine patch superfamily)